MKQGQFTTPASSLRPDGRRNFVHPADVKGRFTRARNLGFFLLILIYVALPWIKINGQPAVFLDIAARRFFLFGGSFNAQDLWLLFFLISGIGFTLFVLTALFGRVFCGYVCPQTVFLEGMFRKIERLIEGPRNLRIKRNSGPWTISKIIRKTIKHAVFLLMATFVAHVFISYFVSLPKLFLMMRQNPAQHLTAFGWVIGITGVLYFNFAWFREQTCTIVCPYGRLQSVMTDLDTIVIGYDEIRGEPRGKKNDAGAADCVDCDRCVVVCPTGIDIRNGLQLDCIGCAACIDACDEVMVKLNRPTGLVRYDSLRGLRGKPRKFWRPRLVLYGVLGAVGLTVAIFGFRSKTTLEANLLRLGDDPYLVEPDGRIQNLFELHLVNKQSAALDFEITSPENSSLEYIISVPTPHLKGGAGTRIPVFVYAPPHDASVRIELEVRQQGSKTSRKLHAPFLRPR